VPIEVYPPTERAQLFTRHDYRGDSPELPPGTSYIELELTGPRQSLSPGESASLTTVWERARLSEDERSPVDVASRLRAR
jgi:hypothetical protein